MADVHRYLKKAFDPQFEISRFFFVSTFRDDSKLQEFTAKVMEELRLAFKNLMNSKIKLFKGNNADEELISIGELFQNFIIGLPQMENTISDALLASVPELAAGQIVEMRYRTSGGFTEYYFKAIEEMTSE